MNLIEIDSTVEVELWPGRRLLVLRADGPDLFSLPRGAMKLTDLGKRASIYFGSPTRSTVQLAGPAVRVNAIADAIIEMERPTGAVKVQ